MYMVVYVHQFAFQIASTDQFYISFFTTFLSVLQFKALNPEEYVFATLTLYTDIIIIPISIITMFDCTYAVIIIP